MGSCGSKIKLNPVWVAAAVRISASKPPEGPEAEAVLGGIAGLNAQILACEEARNAVVEVSMKLKGQQDATELFRKANSSGTDEDILSCQDVAAKSTALLLEFRNAAVHLAEAIAQLIFRLMPNPQGTQVSAAALQTYIPVIQGHINSEPVQRFILPTVCRGVSALLHCDFERGQRPQLMNDVSIFRRTTIRCPLPENHPLHHEKVDTANLALWMGCPLASISHCVGVLSTKCSTPGAILALFGLTNALIASVDAGDITTGSNDVLAPEAQLVLAAMLLCACDAKERSFDTSSLVMGSYFVQTVSRWGEQGVTALRVIKCCCVNGTTSDSVRVQELLQEV